MPTGTSWTLFKALMRQAAEVRGALHIRMPVGQSGWQGRPVAFFDRLEDFDKRVLSRVLPEALKAFRVCLARSYRVHNCLLTSTPNLGSQSARMKMYSSGKTWRSRP